MNNLISAFIQIVILSVLPFVWWLFTARKKISFFKWIGLKKPVIEDKKGYLIVFISAVVLFTAMSFILLPILSDSTSLATSQFEGKGIIVLFPALIYAFLQTGLSEELLFRGFFGKRFINKWGFSVGNIVQASLFGALHGGMLIGSIGLLKSIIVILFTGGIGWMMGYIDEKKSGGSIISSFLMHGIANLISSFVAMFNFI